MTTSQPSANTSSGTRASDWPPACNCGRRRPVYQQMLCSQDAHSMYPRKPRGHRSLIWADAATILMPCYIEYTR